MPNQDPNTVRCGDNKVGLGESCDDNNTVNGDGCSSLCQWEYALAQQPNQCGNYILEGSEACDAGPSGNAACDAQCLSLSAQACGNGAVEPGEQCDTHDRATCNLTTCLWSDAQPLNACANSVVEPGEECDDGNGVDGDGCSAICTIEPRHSTPVTTAPHLSLSRARPARWSTPTAQATASL